MLESGGLTGRLEGWPGEGIVKKVFWPAAQGQGQKCGQMPGLIYVESRIFQAARYNATGLDTRFARILVKI